MSKIIKDDAIIENEYTLVDADSANTSDSNVILPLAFYLENSKALAGRNDVGVWIDAGEDAEDIAPFASSLPMIAVNFPAFSDGRAYSSASILRRNYDYQGEIRAIGDVRRDQLNQMVLCGINAFEIAPGQSLELCLQALSAFSYNYQSTVSKPVPLFRQR